MSHSIRPSPLPEAFGDISASKFPQDRRPEDAEYRRARDISFDEKDCEGCRHWLPQVWAPVPAPAAPAGLHRRNDALAKTAIPHQCSPARKADPTRSRAVKKSSLARFVPWRPEEMRSRDEPPGGSG